MLGAILNKLEEIHLHFPHAYYEFYERHFPDLAFSTGIQAAGTGGHRACGR